MYFAVSVDENLCLSVGQGIPCNLALVVDKLGGEISAEKRSQIEEFAAPVEELVRVIGRKRLNRPIRRPDSLVRGWRHSSGTSGQQIP
jgi:hypothetical protein